MTCDASTDANDIIRFPYRFKSKVLPRAATNQAHRYGSRASLPIDRCVTGLRNVCHRSPQATADSVARAVGQPTRGSHCQLDTGA
ncbi:hypothetical protein BN2476_90028 [Paraburkholderia piptadeniae]|uniref:Uncharacterized protein n=1 Tax=Paraburkholderia piptadeniae TaxID=1701573 RepID=A0A1N7RML6_9BURK|nr:hypothetical protein BN2476_90028 [Paraburkholderia piptadeniae]